MPFVEYQVVNLGIQRKENDIVQYWDEYIDKAKSCQYKLMAWNVWHKSSVSVGQQSAFIPIYHEWIFVFGTKFKDINRTWERGSDISNKKKRKVRQADGSMKESTIGKQETNKEMESVFSSNVELGDIRSLHPATFPIELANKVIQNFAKSCDIVYDPFMGSGTTAKMSIATKRNYIGSEISEEYCKIIEKRISSVQQNLF
jgi:site-specific DNA-methyltransferase (adenine-specific)